MGNNLGGLGRIPSVPVGLVVIAAIILVLTIPSYLACVGLTAVVGPTDCWSPFAPFFWAAVLLIVAAVILFLIE